MSQAIRDDRRGPAALLVRTDFAKGGVALPVILVGHGEAAVVEKTAWPPIDGLYPLEVPVARGQVPGIQFGQPCE